MNSTRQVGGQGFGHQESPPSPSRRVTVFKLSERRQTPAEEGQAGDVRRTALLALQGPSASAGAGGGKGQQHAERGDSSVGQTSGDRRGRIQRGRRRFSRDCGLSWRKRCNRGRTRQGWSRQTRSGHIQDQDLQGNGPGRRHRDTVSTLQCLEEHDRGLEDQLERRRRPLETSCRRLPSVCEAEEHPSWTLGCGGPTVQTGQNSQVRRLLYVLSFWRLHQEGDLGTRDHWRLEQSLACLRLRNGSARRRNEDEETQTSLGLDPTDGATTSGGSSLARSTICASCTSSVSGAGWQRNTPSCYVWGCRYLSRPLHLGTWLFARPPGTSIFGQPKSTRRCSNTAQEQVDRWCRCCIAHDGSMRYGHGLLLHPFRSLLLWGLSCFSFT